MNQDFIVYFKKVKNTALDLLCADLFELIPYIWTRFIKKNHEVIE